VVSRENVETLGDAYEWFRANGMFPAHLGTPDVILRHVPLSGLARSADLRGCARRGDFFVEWSSAWDSWEPAVEAMLDAGDKVVAILRLRGRSKMGGVPVELSMAHVVTFRDGKTARTDNYSDPHEALKTVGLEQ
jgi:ketosteroid isomerase-like protein